MTFGLARGTFPRFRCQPVGGAMKRMLMVLAMAITSGCSAPVDVAKAVQVTVVTSGWVAVGVADGKNKIVPAVTLTLKNVSNQALNALQVNAVFRLVSTNDELASDFRPVSGSGGIATGATTDKILLKAQRGYTGTDPEEELLKNSKFVDAKVEVFVKAGSGQWTRIGDYPIAREFTGG
jgi:hypothetical protein